MGTWEGKGIIIGDRMSRQHSPQRAAIQVVRAEFPAGDLRPWRDSPYTHQSLECKKIFRNSALQCCGRW